LFLGVRHLLAKDWMERFAVTISEQEVELEKLQAEVEELLSGTGGEEVTGEVPEELVKAKVENDKLRYRLNILQKAVEEELSSSSVPTTNSNITA